MSENELPEYRIAKLHFEPGDTLVVKIDQELRPETVERLRWHLEKHISPQIKILVIGPDIELLQIKPPVPDA